MFPWILIYKCKHVWSINLVLVLVLAQFCSSVSNQSETEWVIPEKIHSPPDGWGRFSTSPLTGISWSPRPHLLSGFPRQKTPPPAWIYFKPNIWWKLKKTLKNTKCEGVKVNQSFTFFTSNITQNNRDLTWNYSTVARWVWVRVKMCQAVQILRCNNVARVFSILFTFSAIKRPAKELRVSFMLGEK